MRYELHIAGRYLRSLRRRRRASFTVLTALLGVTLGVGALGVVLSISNGFSGMVWDRILGISSHITLTGGEGRTLEERGDLAAKLETDPDVIGAAVYLAAEGYAIRRSDISGETLTSGVRIQGISAEGLLKASRIGSFLWGGDVTFDVERTRSGERVYNAVLGRYLADRLGVVIGSEVHLGMLPSKIRLLEMPRLRRYRVAGIFYTGNPDLDSSLMFVPIEAAQRDLGDDAGIPAIRMRVRDPFDMAAVLDRFRHRLELEGFEVEPWTGRHGSLYFSMNLEKWASFMAVGLILVVAGFNIVSILFMNVAERKREIGILKTMGVTPKGVGRIFTLQGLAIGIGGVILGNVLGIGFCWIQLRYELLKLPGQVLIIDALPVEMQAFDFAVISAAALAVCFLFTRWPARRASALDPIEAIRR